MLRETTLEASTDSGLLASEYAERSAYWRNSHPSDAQPRRRRERRATPLILTGHGLSIRVEKGSLLISDGLTHYPQEKASYRFFKGALDTPQRVVLVDGSGDISLDALDWMAAQGVALIRLRWDGEASAVMSPTGYAADPKLVAWQRETRDDPAARLAFSLKLVADKLDACLATLRDEVTPSRFRDTAIAEVERARDRIANDPPATVQDLLGIEGKAAKAYFTAWRGIPLQWREAKRRPIPEAWRTYDTRTSLASGAKARNRHASHPLNAMLNYAYGALQARVAIRAIAEGYDPTVGIMHRSKLHERDGVHAYALDLMEPERPRVDAGLLRFVRETTFSGGDFALREDGVCRLNPELARVLVKSTLGSEQPC